MRKEKEEVSDQYPWLNKDDERRNMPDKEIIEKYVDLEKSCVSESEKKEVMDMLYKYKDIQFERLNRYMPKHRSVN